MAGSTPTRAGSVKHCGTHLKKKLKKIRQYNSTQKGRGKSQLSDSLVGASMRETSWYLEGRRCLDHCSMTKKYNWNRWFYVFLVNSELTFGFCTSPELTAGRAEGRWGKVCADPRCMATVLPGCSLTTLPGSLSEEETRVSVLSAFIANDWTVFQPAG